MTGARAHTLISRLSSIIRVPLIEIPNVATTLDLLDLSLPEVSLRPTPTQLFTSTLPRRLTQSTLRTSQHAKRRIVREGFGRRHICSQSHLSDLTDGASGSQISRLFQLWLLGADADGQASSGALRTR